MSENDQRILELRAQIATKKKELGDAERFNPITHCSIELNGERHNLHTQSKNDLAFLLVVLNSYNMSAGELELDGSTIYISDFSITDWMTDIKAKIANMSIKEEKRRLKALEDKLELLLSSEKKTELAIDEIASSL